MLHVKKQNHNKHGKIISVWENLSKHVIKDQFHKREDQ